MRLEAHSIIAGYDSRNVLENVSMTVATGEFVGLLGQNGSGKSTLLRVLTHALKPHSGSVELDGKPIVQWSPKDRAKRIAFVPQQETTTFAFTVQDVVLMGRYPHLDRNRREQSEDYAIARRAMESTDTLALQDRPVTRLSGGEYRRVLMARALAQQSPLLLLDEPTAHLDIAHQAELLALAQQLAHRSEKPQGVLAALHDINQAAEFCDRIVLLLSGRVLAEGTPDAVLTEDNLRRAYNAEVRMGQNPLTGRPMIFSLQSQSRNS